MLFLSMQITHVMQSTLGCTTSGQVDLWCVRKQALQDSGSKSWHFFRTSASVFCLMVSAFTSLDDGLQDTIRQSKPLPPKADFDHGVLSQL